MLITIWLININWNLNMAKIKEGKETYSSKTAMKKHEKTETKRKETSEKKAMKKGAKCGCK